jgi:hypothetical protein
MKFVNNITHPIIKGLCNHVKLLDTKQAHLRKHASTTPENEQKTI